MTDFIGRTIGQYVIQSELMKSGVSTIYRAVQPGLQREVAIKILPQQFMYDYTFLERFKREVHIIARLQHPHIVPIYDYGEQDGSPYMVMGYYAGDTLGNYIRQSPGEISLKEASRIISQIAGALDYAHLQGVIHRNVKPDNIILDEEHNAYLWDFGVAKVAEATAQLTGDKVLGTPQYMAPEMASPGGVSHLSDVYALGITLFEMLTREPPYDASHQIGVLLAHVNQPIPLIGSLRSNLPTSIQKVIDGVLEKEPSKRYKSAGAFARALEDVIEDTALPVSQQPSKPPQMSRPDTGYRPATSEPDLGPVVPMSESLAEPVDISLGTEPVPVIPEEALAEPPVVAEPPAPVRPPAPAGPVPDVPQLKEVEEIPFPLPELEMPSPAELSVKPTAPLPDKREPEPPQRDLAAVPSMPPWPETAAPWPESGRRSRRRDNSLYTVAIITIVIGFLAVIALAVLYFTDSLWLTRPEALLPALFV